MLIQDGSSIDTQRGFFVSHINSWFQQFFTEMSAAQQCSFLQSGVLVSVPHFWRLKNVIYPLSDDVHRYLCVIVLVELYLDA